MRQIDRLQERLEWMNEEVKKDVFDWRLVENFWSSSHVNRKNFILIICAAFYK